MSQEHLRYEQLIDPGDMGVSEQILIDRHLEEHCQKDKDSPLDKAGFFSRIFFIWMNPILSVSFYTNLYS